MNDLVIADNKEKQILCAAALLGRSNMGHGLPPKEEVTNALLYSGKQLNNYVEAFCEQFMENDEHHTWFMEEAEAWVDRVRRDGLEPWPHVKVLFE